MRLDLFLALRLLKEARTQSLLIASGAAVGVAVLIFLSALISGLQQDLLSRTVGSQAHLTIAPEPYRPPGLFEAALGDSATVISVREVSKSRIRTLNSPTHLLSYLRDFRNLTASSPLCEGPATALRGSATENVTVSGIDTQTFTSVIDLKSRITAGAFEVGNGDAVLGAALADALSVTIGDRFRMRSEVDDGSSFVVRGIVRVGVKRSDETMVLLSLRDAQALLGSKGGITSVAASVSDIFDAEEVASALRDRTGLSAVSWMERNSELLTGLRSQSSSSTLIQVFVLLSVAIGIASVLAVSVVQRRREIGILRSMGLPRGATQRIFLIQGGLLGFGGAVLGCGLGTLLILAFEQFAVRADGARLFPIALTPGLLGAASAVSVVTGVLSAAFPARRAAHLDPMVAIRNE